MGSGGSALGSSNRRLKPAGRVCGSEDCDTVLSRYNPTDYCRQCDDPRAIKGGADEDDSTDDSVLEDDPATRVTELELLDHPDD